MEMAPVPVGEKEKQVTDGAFLAHKPMAPYLYVMKGNRTDEFYRYDIAGGGWQSRAPIPRGREGKLPFFGSRGVQDDSVFIYCTKGHNTPAFWRYDIPPDTWTQMADIPAQPNGDTKVAGGTDLVYVPGDSAGVGDVYLLKGHDGEFYRYNTATGEWEDRQHAPPNKHNKEWDFGSFLTYDGAQTIYAHRSFANEIWTFDLVTQSWSDEPAAGMPGVQSQDGGCGDWYDGSVFALKGGKSDEFWQYAAGGNWTGLDPMPKLGSSGKERMVFKGADIIAHGCDAFFALKGHDTRELWRYVLEPEGNGGGQDGMTPTLRPYLAIAPNPLARDAAILRYSLPSLGPACVSVFDAAGRLALEQSVLTERRGTLNLDLRGLSAGVYLVRLNALGFSATQKLVVQK